MNQIWAGLIIISFLFAVGSDIKDEVTNTYENGQEIIVKQISDQRVSFGEYVLAAKIISSSGKEELILSYSDDWPEKFLTNTEARGKSGENIRVVVDRKQDGALHFVLPPVHLVKLRAITSAAFDMAEVAVKLALGLIGVMAFWLGLLKIAEDSKLVDQLVRLVHPLIGRLFPDVPKDHPALANISLNLTANIMGLGNAATPLGIKAMEELQKLNGDSDKASHAMCMFLAINTSSVQLLPPVTLVALMGIGVSELMISITLATIVSTIVGVTGALYYRRKEEKYA